MSSADELSKEIKAIEGVVTALTGMDKNAQTRVLEFVSSRLGLGTLPSRTTPPGHGSDIVENSGAKDSAAPGVIRDIRTLRETKQPNTAVEMAAVIAYYLTDLAPPDERKDSVNTADLEKYFKQANYPLPTAIRHTLPNAAKAGYFDSAGRGAYTLNPVGHNLVVHNLPSEKTSEPKKRPARKKTAKRSARKRTARGRKTTKSSAGRRARKT